MTNAQHTPGPWTIEEGRDLTAREQNGFGQGHYFDIIDSEGNPVVVNAYDVHSHAENIANARLIAAAPETAAERDMLKEINAELLEACRLALIAIDYIESTQLGKKTNTGNTIRAAIAKAEGK